MKYMHACMHPSVVRNADGALAGGADHPLNINLTANTNNINQLNIKIAAITPLWVN